jgi:hypothetical protein
LLISWGQSPQTPWVGFAELWVKASSAKQNKRFLLLFLEKEEYQTVNIALGIAKYSKTQTFVYWGKSQNPKGRLRRGMG